MTTSRQRLCRSCGVTDARLFCPGNLYQCRYCQNAANQERKKRQAAERPRGVVTALDLMGNW